MNLDRLPHLSDYMDRRLADASVDTEERAHIENFLLDERLPQDGIDLYTWWLKTHSITDIDNWKNRHETFVAKELNLGVVTPKQPWTFRKENEINWLREIDPDIYLIRVETVSWAGGTAEDIRHHIEKFNKGSETDKSNATICLKRIADDWNLRRDKRPSFATIESEVKDIIDNDSPDWAERLRDRLGLGCYSPSLGVDCRPVEIILMRYKVQEILDSLDSGGYFAIPTVLDKEMNPHFFPSPIPVDQTDDSYYGHTVNLGLVKKDDYQMGVELLHSRIDYKPEHFLKVGVIARPFEMPLERARDFHLPWLRLYSERDDYGTQLFGDKL